MQLAKENTKKDFITKANLVKKLYKSYLPDRIEKAYAERAII